MQDLNSLCTLQILGATKSQIFNSPRSSVHIRQYKNPWKNKKNYGRKYLNAGRGQFINLFERCGGRNKNLSFQTQANKENLIAHWHCC